MTNSQGAEHPTRREVLTRFLAGAGCFAVTAPLLASAQALASQPINGDVYLFPQGVASGDPQPDGIVLWTRVLPADGGTRPVAVLAEVARDEAFTDIIVRTAIAATADSDHTVRLFVDGLDPATTYFYRFRAGQSVSVPLGRTRTAAAPDDLSPVVLAMASCQNYQAGTFDAYRRMIAEDEARDRDEQVQLVLHLGDFIYEAIYGGVGAGEDSPGPLGARVLPPFPSAADQAQGNRSVPPHAQTLADYRHLYRTYLADTDLMAARARWPFVCTWDDHEFSDDSWQAHHTYGGEGAPAQPRKVAANQAWFEYMPALLTGARGVDGVPPQARDFTPAAVQEAPVGPVDGENRPLEPNMSAAIGTLTIYRSLRLGAHAELVVTDARSYRSDHAVPEDMAIEAFGASRSGLPVDLIEVLDAGRAADGGNPPQRVEHQGKSFANPRRESPPGTMLGPDQKAWWKATMAASTATWKLWASSVPVLPLRFDVQAIDPELGERAVSADAWDGYPGERRELTSFLAETPVPNVIALSGDHHAAFAGVLAREYGRRDLEPVAVELSVAGISSPSMWTLAREFDDDRLARLVAYEPLSIFPGSQEEVPNLNLALLYGTKSAGIAALSGMAMVGKWFRNPDHNAHLALFDSDAYGYCLVRLDAERMTAEHVVIERPARAGQAPVRYRARYAAERWDQNASQDEAGAQSGPVLQGPDFEGTPPFPF